MLKKKKILSLVAATCIVTTSISPAFAKVTDYVTEDATGETFKYSKNALLESILNGTSLYNNYKSQTLKALLDDQRGYIDANDVRDAISSTDNLDVDSYTESTKAKQTDVKVDNTVSVNEKGEVVVTPEKENALKVESVSVIDANTIEVTFEGVEEAVKLELDEALVNGENEVTFTYEKVEYTVTVNYEDPEVVLDEAKEAVEKAENSLLDADYNTAKELVDALKVSNQKTLLNARLIELKDVRAAILKSVQSSKNNIALNEALQQKPFKDVVVDNIADYSSAKIKSADSLAAVQEIINTVNANKEDATLGQLVTDAKDAVNADGLNSFAPADKDGQDKFDDLVKTAQEAIDKLPADYTEKDAEAPLKEVLQTKLDAVKKLNADFVKLVTPINEAAKAENQIQLNNALKAAGIKDLNTDNIEEYVKAIASGKFTTLKDVQNSVLVVNTDQTIAALTGDKLTQENINAAQALIDALVKAKVNGTEDLQDALDEKQTALDNQNEEAKALAEAIKEAEKVMADYIAAGGSKDSNEYKAVVAALEADSQVTDKITTATTELEAAISQTDLMKALKKVNDAETNEDMKKAIEAAVLGLEVREGSDYAKLIDNPNRKISVSVDLLSNRPTKGYTVEGLQKYFNEIVATRLVTQESMDTVNKAEKLDNINFVTALRDRLEKVSYEIHSGQNIKEKILPALNTSIDGFNELAPKYQEEVLAKVVKADDYKSVNEILAAFGGALQPATINDTIAKEDVDALQEIILGVGSKTFANLSKAQRAELGEYIINQAKNEDPVVVYESAQEFKTAIDKETDGFVAKYQADIAAFNTAANAEKITGENKQNLVDAIEELVSLEGLSQVDKLDLAEAIFAAKPEGGYAIKTIAQIKDIAATTPYSLR